MVVGSAQVRYTDDLQNGEYVDVPGTSTDNLVYLGDFSIPAVELNGFKTTVTSADLQLNIQYDITGTATVRFYGFFLVPLDIPPFTVTCDANTIIPTRSMVVDGVNEIAYQVETSSGNAAYDRPLSPKGRFLRYHGGTVNRLFFYAWEGTDYTHDDEYTIASGDDRKFFHGLGRLPQGWRLTDCYATAGINRQIRRSDWDTETITLANDSGVDVTIRLEVW